MQPIFRSAHRTRQNRQAPVAEPQQGQRPFFAHSASTGAAQTAPTSFFQGMAQSPVPAAPGAKKEDGHNLKSARFSGNDTLERCYDGEPAHFLKSGSSGSPVEKIQQALIDLGYPMPLSTQKTGTPDGLFGPETKATVKKFQQDNGLADDGIVGPNTMTALDDKFAAGPGPGPAPTPPSPAPPSPAPTPAPLVISSKTVKSAPDGSSDSRNEIGVGEKVVFTGSVAGTWKFSAGKILGANGGATVRWEAPATGSTVTITLTTATSTGTTTRQVLPPDGLSMKKKSTDVFPAGSPGAGMITDVTILPLKVNLGATNWLEVPGPATNITGYYTKFNAADLKHNPNLNFVPFNDTNTGPTDHAAQSGHTPVFKDGTMQWDIPNKYKIDGEADASARLFVTTTQLFVIDAAGTVTITKAGASVSRTP